MAMDAKTRTVMRLVGVVVLMGGLAWAAFFGSAFVRDKVAPQRGDPPLEATE